MDLVDANGEELIDGFYTTDDMGIFSHTCGRNFPYFYIERSPRGIIIHRKGLVSLILNPAIENHNYLLSELRRIEFPEEIIKEHRKARTWHGEVISFFKKYNKRKKPPQK